MWNCIASRLSSYRTRLIYVNCIPLYMRFDTLKSDLILVSSIVTTFYMKSVLSFLINNGIPFIVIAQQHSFKIEQNARNLGCSAYLFPDEIDSLNETVRSLIEQS